MSSHLTQTLGLLYEARKLVAHGELWMNEQKALVESLLTSAS